MESEGPGQIFPSSNSEAEAGPVPSAGQPREEARGLQAVVALGELPAAETDTEPLIRTVPCGHQQTPWWQVDYIGQVLPWKEQHWLLLE